MYVMLTRRKSRRKSRRDGSLVVIAETEPLHGHPSNMLLQEVATIADVLPPP